MNTASSEENGLGAVPTEWQVVSLENIATIATGGSAPQGEQYFSNGMYPFVRVRHFDGSTEYVERWDRITAQAVEEYNLRLFPKESIVFPRSGASITLEKRGKLKVDSYVVGHLCVIRGLQDIVNQQFLYFLMRFCNFAKDKAGTTLPYLNTSDIANRLVPLPPLPEQKRIAIILSKIQQAIEWQEKIIERTKELKKALMAKLFTEGLHGEELKETEIRFMPKSWDVVELAQLADIVYGVQAAVAHATDSSIGTPIFTNINITNDGELDLQTIRYYKVPEKKRDRLILKQGDILFNWRSGSREHVGKTAIFALDGEYTFSSFILRFRTKDMVRNTFLYYSLQHLKQIGYFSQFRQVSSVNSVFNASSSATIPIGVPTMAEQDVIAEAMAKVIAMVKCEDQRQKRLHNLFRAMLHQLMTGQIRVNNIEIPFDA